METGVGLGRVLVLSGPSSSGKSATARQFQHQIGSPWLVLDADVVLGTYPHSPASDLAETTRRLNRALFASVASFAREGFDVICEQVFWNGTTYRDALRCLAGLPARFVGLTARLEESERREWLRGDRSPGTSRMQRIELCDGVRYDFSLDTTTVTPAAAASALVDWVDSEFSA